MAGCGGGKMIPKYKDGGMVTVPAGSTRGPSPELASAMRKFDIIKNSATPMPDNLTPAEQKALDAYHRQQAAEQAARERKYDEMNRNMQKGYENYERSRREGQQ
jgi:hypothetical protein